MKRDIVIFDIPTRLNYGVTGYRNASMDTIGNLATGETDLLFHMVKDNHVVERFLAVGPVTLAKAGNTITFTVTATLQP